MFWTWKAHLSIAVIWFAGCIIEGSWINLLIFVFNYWCALVQFNVKTCRQPNCDGVLDTKYKTIRVNQGQAVIGYQVCRRCQQFSITEEQRRLNEVARARARMNLD